MSAFPLGNAIFDPTGHNRSRQRAHNARRALIVRRHRAMLRESKPTADHAGSPDVWLEQLPSSLVGE